jgi:hypothetical protein
MTQSHFSIFSIHSIFKHLCRRNKNENFFSFFAYRNASCFSLGILRGIKMIMCFLNYVKKNENINERYDKIKIETKRWKCVFRAKEKWKPQQKIKIASHFKMISKKTSPKMMSVLKQGSMTNSSIFLHVYIQNYH